MNGFKRKNLSIPYIAFLLIFIIAPLFVILFYAFTNGQGQFTLDNFINFFTSLSALGTLIYSIAVAFITTVVCLLIAYPVAYFLACSRYSRKNVLLVLFILPMWINFTLRITALKEILTFVEGNLAYYPFLNTIIGLTYDFLPFMILPIYNVLEKLDNSYLEAARDLGANGFKAFVKVTLPLSVPGIISGVTMVFLPAMTNYVVLDMLYNSTYVMGNLISSFFTAYNWNSGSMTSLILLILVFVITALSGEFKSENGKGERL